MYLKLYGRFENQENDEREFLCKKCLCEDQGMPSEQFQEKARQFSEQGCDLF
jgi:phosphoadenosine phosphosulfate reductase